MKALLEKDTAHAIQMAKKGVILRRIVYGAIIVCVLVLAFVSAFGRLSMMMDVHNWIFGR